MSLFDFTLVTSFTFTVLASEEDKLQRNVRSIPDL